MSPLANPLVSATAEPAILEARSWLEQYEGGSGPALDLSQAGPPYPPSDAFLERIAAASRDGGTARYGAVRGEADLREAYAEHLRGVLGSRTRIAPEAVTVTAGCNQAFFITALALLQRGDEVVLPCPWYFNHKMTLDMLGVGVRPLPCMPEAGYLPDLAQAERLIGDRTRAVILVTPNNPTGAEYPPALIEAFHDLCRRRKLWLVLDETYRDFRLGEGPPHGLAQGDWPDDLIALYSFSKAYAVPGHRLGAITAATALGREILKVQDCVQICAGRAVQMAMTWGLGHLDAWRAERRREIAVAAGALRSALKGTGWSIESMGAYFAYLRHPLPGATSEEVAARLARDYGVLVIPGSSFGPGQESVVRLSFPSLTASNAADLADRLRAFGRIGKRMA